MRERRGKNWKYCFAFSRNKYIGIYGCGSALPTELRKIARMIKMNGSAWCWLCAFGNQILKRQTLSTNYFVWSHLDATVSLNNWLAKTLNEKVVCVKTVGAQWFRKVLHIWSFRPFSGSSHSHKRTHFMSSCKWSLVLFRLPHTSLHTNVTRMLC